MAFPRKFKHLLEIELKDIEAPDYVWLTYAVCACEHDSCGWGGWMIEAAFKETPDEYPTSTGDKVLPAVMSQVCPRCGKTTFRTAASVRLEPSEDQTPSLVEGRDYKSVPMEYSDEPDDPLPGFHAGMFREITWDAMDALVVFVEKGKERSEDLRRALDDMGQSRWYILKNGWNVKCPYVGQEFDPELFTIEKDGWGHEHCDVCNAGINAGQSCWLAENDEDTLICGACYERLKDRQESR